MKTVCREHMLKSVYAFKIRWTHSKKSLTLGTLNLFHEQFWTAGNLHICLLGDSSVKINK